MIRRPIIGENPARRRGGTADRPARFPGTRSMRRALPRRTAQTRSP